MSLEPLDARLHDFSDAEVERKQRPLRFVTLDATNYCVYVRLKAGNSIGARDCLELARELEYAGDILGQLVVFNGKPRDTSTKHR